MKFRRKSTPADASADTSAAEGAPASGEASGTAEETAPAVLEVRPHDVDEVDLADGVQRIDLGSLLITPTPGRELRLQVDEKTKTVQSVVIAAPDGALELKAFAAPRGGGLWDDVRPQIAADMAQRGGTATEQEGQFGTELACQLSVRRADGTTAVQPSRIIGFDGARWLLRATLLGRPAVDPEAAADWESTIAGIVVRRGEGAMPVGDALPLVMPANARRSG
ncbi:DUF3710 domain-containing protein [Nocardioides pacificus]